MTKKAPEILWHYTSIDTLVKICTNLTMRATHYAFMNDAEEVKAGAKRVLRQLNSTKWYPEYIGNVEYVRGNMECLIREFDTKKFYIVSFSKTKDALSLWRGYASQGGCAIGFSAIALKSLFNNYCGPQDEKKLLFNECVYGESDIRYLKTKISLVNKNIPDREDVLNRLICSPICCSKNQCFADEQEIRMAFIRQTNDEVHFENGKPFIELKMQEAVFPNLIKEVMISPHGDVKKNEQYVRFFSRYLGEKYGTNASDGLLFPVTKSKLPYRG